MQYAVQLLLCLAAECAASDGTQCHFPGGHASETVEDICTQVQGLLQVSQLSALI